MSTVQSAVAVAAALGPILTSLPVAPEVTNVTTVPLIVTVSLLTGLATRAIEEVLAAAEKLESILQHSRQEPKVLILRMQKVVAMDSTALHTLEHLHQKLNKRGIRLILSGPHTQPYFLMVKSGFLDQLGEENIAGDIDDALVKAQTSADYFENTP